ncbi:MAG TPA: metallophosphoesterase [Candidatus Aenigmarchaeota archaeon]|nr:metallophosphoesterase [Candidatus Aenigmarchaeota archaeon]
MVEIERGMEIVGKGLFIKKLNTMVLSDLHIGYEHALEQQGIMIPKSQYPKIKKEIVRMLDKSGAGNVIINGDVKHEFGEISRQEWFELNDFLELMASYNPIFIRGNHDNFLVGVLKKMGIPLYPYLLKEGMLFIHGDKEIDKDIVNRAKVIVMGHEHPAYVIRDEFGNLNRFKCFLKASIYGKLLIVLPALNPLMPGSEINTSGMFLSPILAKARIEKAYVIEGDDVFIFSL